MVLTGRDEEGRFRKSSREEAGDARVSLGVRNSDDDSKDDSKEVSAVRGSHWA